MSFKLDNLTPVANNTKTGVVPAIWVYFNEDNDTITTAGFIPTGYGISNGDQVLVIANTIESNSWYHAEVEDNVITLAENS